MTVFFFAAALIEGKSLGELHHFGAEVIDLLDLLCLQVLQCCLLVLLHKFQLLLGCHLQMRELRRHRMVVRTFKLVDLYFELVVVSLTHVL